MSDTPRLREITTALAGVLAELGFTRLRLIARGVPREVRARVTDLPREIEALLQSDDVTLEVMGTDLRVLLRRDGTTSVEGSAPQRSDVQRALDAVNL